MHGRILLFQIEMLTLLEHENGLREKVDLLVAKKNKKKGFLPPNEYLNLVSALIAYGEMDTEYAAHATKSMLSLTSSRVFFIITEDDQNWLVKSVQRFMTSLPPTDDYVPEKYNKKHFSQIIRNKKLAHPFELISLFGKGKNMKTHVKLNMEHPAMIQFVSCQWDFETDFSDTMKVALRPLTSVETSWKWTENLQNNVLAGNSTNQKQTAEYFQDPGSPKLRNRNRNRRKNRK